MLKNISKLEVIIEGKTIQLLCDSDTPTTSIKEALFQYLKFIGQFEDAAKAAKDTITEESELKEEAIG